MNDSKVHKAISRVFDAFNDFGCADCFFKHNEKIFSTLDTLEEINDCQLTFEEIIALQNMVSELIDKYKFKLDYAKIEKDIILENHYLKMLNKYCDLLNKLERQKELL